MFAKRLMLVAGCTCCLLAWAAELEDLQGCSSTVDESERLACFERITRLLINQRASGHDRSEQKELVVESGENEEVQQGQEQTQDSAEDTKVEVADVETKEVLGNKEVVGKEERGVAEAVSTEEVVEERAEQASEGAGDVIRGLTIPVPSQSSRSEPSGETDDFGKRDNKNRPASLSSVIVKVKKSRVRTNIYILTLANGQVWRETQFGKGTNYRSGDRVTIKSARMGSFVLTNRRTGFNCHVKRID